ncbi:hypothetical protein GCM10009799_16760 [Nocardiopsis rhodophaea]|uniref:Uncharacterized protein n=1 Tax=Nocardiopsis rhodophaea TaxID=280238 RepID=A0ABN2SRW6_9ACTN
MGARASGANIYGIAGSFRVVRDEAGEMPFSVGWSVDDTITGIRVVVESVTIERATMRAIRYMS